MNYNNDNQNNYYGQGAYQNNQPQVNYNQNPQGQYGQQQQQQQQQGYQMAHQPPQGYVPPQANGGGQPYPVYDDVHVDHIQTTDQPVRLSKTQKNVLLFCGFLFFMIFIALIFVYS